MNIDKIKDFVVENKKYVIAAIVVIFTLLFFRHGNKPKADNSALLSEKTEQSQSSQKEEAMSSGMQNTASEQPKTVTCDISGAVKHEGVYTLKNGARIQELIEAAGGLKSNVQLKAINRAVMLKDQDKIHIPYKGEKVENAATVGNDAGHSSNQNASPTQQSGDSSEKVNINTASAADLQKLNGIGEKKAEQIIAYRDQNGGFKKIEDLMQVSGIGEKTFAALKDQLAI